MYAGRYEIYYQDIPAKSRYLNAVGGYKHLETWLLESLTFQGKFKRLLLNPHPNQCAFSLIVPMCF